MAAADSSRVMEPLPSQEPIWETRALSTATISGRSATAAAEVKILSEGQNRGKEPSALLKKQVEHQALKAQVTAVLEQFTDASLQKGATRAQIDAAYRAMQQKMALLFVKHGGQVMQYMWGLNGDMNGDVVGDLNVRAGYPASIKDVMEGVIDCIRTEYKVNSEWVGPKFPAKVKGGKKLNPIPGYVAPRHDEELGGTVIEACGRVEFESA